MDYFISRIEKHPRTLNRAPERLAVRIATEVLGSKCLSTFMGVRDISQNLVNESAGDSTFVAKHFS